MLQVINAHQIVKTCEIYKGTLLTLIIFIIEHFNLSLGTQLTEGKG